MEIVTLQLTEISLSTKITNGNKTKIKTKKLEIFALKKLIKMNNAHNKITFAQYLCLCSCISICIATSLIKSVIIVN